MVTKPDADAADNDRMTEPYRCNEDLIDDQIRWTLATLRGQPILEELAEIADRVQATRMAQVLFPMLALEARFTLSESEIRVLWLLLAHELDPAARALLRERSTEQTSDVTFDVIRNVVYGPRARARTWRELGPEGKLRSLALIERTDGAGEAPEQRQTFKLARRVLALAYGEL
ncbi:MAG TPA: hypothetical protein VMJ10_19050, partial [Kofleriaceae bacterium]|nr:hypothetical protein [Kofleriaceae bacterium]